MDIYHQAYTNILAQERRGQIDSYLKARLLGKYGWFLYQTHASYQDGTNLVMTALSLCPTNANLNVKVAMIFVDKSIATYAVTKGQADNEALSNARYLYKCALKADPNYGYAYWGLGQISEDVETRMKYRRVFLTMTNHLDMELWLYDEKPYKERLNVARQLVSDKPSSVEIIK